MFNVLLEISDPVKHSKVNGHKQGLAKTAIRIFKNAIQHYPLI